MQLAAQSAKAWARLQNRRQVEVALDRGRSILETMPRPENPDHHFQIDPAKWHFYAMDAYRHLGDNPLAQTYAEEVLRLGTSINGDERSPMRVAEAHVTLGVVAARYGDIDTAAEHGQAALHGVRKSIPTLRMVGQEFAAELANTAAKKDQRLRDYLAELRTATLIGNTADPL